MFAEVLSAVVLSLLATYMLTVKGTSITLNVAKLLRTQLQLTVEYEREL